MIRVSTELRLKGIPYVFVLPYFPLSGRDFAKKEISRVSVTF